MTNEGSWPKYYFQMMNDCSIDRTSLNHIFLSEKGNGSVFRGCADAYSWLSWKLQRGRCKYLYTYPTAVLQVLQIKSPHGALPRSVHRSKSPSTGEGKWSLNTYASKTSWRKSVCGSVGGKKKNSVGKKKMKAAIFSFRFWIALDWLCTHKCVNRLTKTYHYSPPPSYLHLLYLFIFLWTLKSD